MVPAAPDHPTGTGQPESNWKDVAARLEEKLAWSRLDNGLLQRHLHTMSSLAKRRVFISENLSEALTIITELCALALEVQRSSVWLLEERNSSLRCLHLHDQTAPAQGAGGALAAAHFPAYFGEMLKGHVIAADHAQEDPRTREFTEVYLKPLDIHAMLDAPIRLNDRLLGVVCQEHTGTPRHWIQEDIAFATFIAHTVSMVLETHIRRGGTLPNSSGP